MVEISQWAKVNGESASLPDAYFDNTDLEDLYRIPVILENPTWAQKKEIELYKTLYRGIMLVTGKPRSGKDTTLVALFYWTLSPSAYSVITFHSTPKP